MTYSYEFHFDQGTTVTDDLGASLTRHFHGAKLTATAAPNQTANKILVSGSNAIENGDYNAEMTRAKVSALGAFASHLNTGCVKLTGGYGGPTIAHLDGEAIAVYL